MAKRDFLTLKPLSCLILVLLRLRVEGRDNNTICSDLRISKGLIWPQRQRLHPKEQANIFYVNMRETTLNSKK